MSVLPKISMATVIEEIAVCREDAEAYGWVISDPDPVTQHFSVIMTAPSDKEKYELYMQFDNYPEYPLLIDFKDPRTGALGTRHAYPNNLHDSFFHPNGIICHQCSRKSYANYSGLHKDWSLAGWKANAGSITNIHAVLDTIYSRISNQYYAGRMAI
jgi:hypothetical protein